MTAETVEAPQMVSRPDRGTVFTARREGLRLVMRPERKRYDPEGNPIETIAGEHIAFIDGVLRVPAAKTMRGEKGEPLEVEKVLAFLEGHHLNGDREDGFWKLEQPAPAPTTAEMEKIVELGMDLDVDGLRELISQEETGWAREGVLTVARGNLARAEASVAERERAIAEARREGAAAAAKGKPAA